MAGQALERPVSQLSNKVKGIQFKVIALEQSEFRKAPICPKKMNIPDGMMIIPCRSDYILFGIIDIL